MAAAEARKVAVLWRGMVPSVDDGVELSTLLIGPSAGHEPEGCENLPLFVAVHPYGMMGGCRDVMIGTAAHMAEKFGAIVAVFDLRGVGDSTGSCTLTHHNEIADVRGMCRWLHARAEPDLDRILESKSFASDDAGPLLAMLGSSAGSCVAGSSMDEDGVVAGVFSGYVFGWWASILFGGHFAAIKASDKPKCFIQGTADGFTSEAQLRAVGKESKGTSHLVLIEDVGHFELEGPEWEDHVGDAAVDFVRKVMAEAKR
jgi:alpha/beta superfamily hydrolase